GRHLPAADVDELVREPERRLLPPHLAVDLVRAVARATGGEQVLAALLVRHAEVIPHRAPLEVPVELGAALERRAPAAVAAALRPVDEIGAAFVRDRLAVVVGGEGRAEAAAALADHADGKPALVLDDVRHLRVDLADLRRAAQHQVDLRVERARAIEVADPDDLLWMDAELLERREEARRVVAR